LAEGQLRQFAPGRYRSRVRATAGHQIQSWPRRDCGPWPVRAIPAKAKNAEVAAERIAPSSELSFNPKNTFETFVVGNNNNFAYAAALAVAQAPGKS